MQNNVGHPKFFKMIVSFEKFTFANKMWMDVAILGKGSDASVSISKHWDFEHGDPLPCQWLQTSTAPILLAPNGGLPNCVRACAQLQQPLCLTQKH